MAFHAQQPVEQYLKGLLIHDEVAPLRTHDLEEILKRGSEIEEDIDRLRSTGEGLTDCGVAPRYPDTDTTVSPHEAEQAIRAAQEMRGRVRRAVSEM